MAYITLCFPNNILAHLNVNWLSPVKMRTTLVGGERKMLVWNDLEPSEKVKVYDKGVQITEAHDESRQRLKDLIEAKVFEYNRLSANSLRRNGFQREGVLRKAVDGRSWDVFVFGILQDEIEEQRKKDTPHLPLAESEGDAV